MLIQKRAEKIMNGLLQLLAAILIVIVGASFAGIEFSYKVNSMNLSLILLSALVNIAFCRFILYMLKDVKFDKSEIYIIFAAIAVTILVSILSIYSVEHAYYWDETGGYLGYFKLQDTFEKGGNGVLQFLKAMRGNSEGILGTLFAIFPFVFSNRTENSWCVSVAINSFVFFLVVYAIFVKNAARIFQVKKEKLFFALSMVLAISIPIIYTVTSGFIESYGMIGCLCICNIFMNTSFENRQYKRWCAIAVLMLLVVMLKDLYLVWLLAFAISYFVSHIAEMLCAKEYAKLKVWLKNILLFGISLVVIAVGVLLPFIKSFLVDMGNGKDNSFWRTGGYLYQITVQRNYLGEWLAILFIIGIVGGLIKKKTRFYALFAVLQGISTLLIFNLIVTLEAIDHSIILIPFYLMAATLAVNLVTEVKKEWLQVGLKKILILLATLNVICCLAGGRYLDNVFSSISLQKRANQIEEIKEVASWILENCEEGDTAYFIPHGKPYNPDIFRFINMPDRRMLSIMPYGSAVLGYHAFPTSLFDARYVLTCTPFCEYSIAEKYNDTFLEIVSDTDKFELVMEFDMNDGYVISVYERKQPVTLDEIDYYRNAFSEESSEYPALYEEVFDAYVRENNVVNEIGEGK